MRTAGSLRYFGNNKNQLFFDFDFFQRARTQFFEHMIKLSYDHLETFCPKMCAYR